jgi:hypothetical protein
MTDPLELQLVDLSIEDPVHGEADERFVLVDLKYPGQDGCYCYTAKLFLTRNETRPDGTRVWVFGRRD